MNEWINKNQSINESIKKKQTNKQKGFGAREKKRFKTTRQQTFVFRSNASKVSVEGFFDPWLWEIFRIREHVNYLVNVCLELKVIFFVNIIFCNCYQTEGTTN